jgi:D-amino-acid dehydrogenase
VSGRVEADVAVVGAGIVGLSLAYELACLGASVAVVDAGHAGRATDAGAGILSPATSLETDAALWPFLHRCGAHYPLLLERLEADGAAVGEAGYGTCGSLSLILRPHENEWFAPFADIALRRSPGDVAEIGPGDAAALFPPLGRVHRVLHARGAARVDGRGMAAALREGCLARGVVFMTGRAEGVDEQAGSEGLRHASALQVEGQDALACDALAVAGGAWSAAMGEWLGCALPVGPTKGQIVHLGVDGDTGAWPIVQPLLTHYLVPWPGGRVACGGTFESGAGFSATATAAGISELLREGLAVAPGLGGAEYRETRVGLRPMSADDRALVGRLPGWSNAWVATGHGANGLLQGPYSGRVLAHAIAGRDLPADDVPAPKEFDPARVR